MTIAISEVPSTQLIGLAKVQLDRQGTTPGASSQKVGIIGQKTSAGSATANVLVQVTSAQRATALFGVGSQLAIMCQTYLKNDPQADLWAVPLADNGTTKATSTIQVTSAATGDGTIKLRAFGYRVQIGVSSGDSANTIASAIEAALDEIVDLPVTSGVSTDTVTCTARNAGVSGNTGRIEVSPDPGDVLPAGVALTIVQPSGGSTDPAITTAITNIASADLRHIVFHRTDDTAMDALDAELLDRWGAARGKLSTVISCLVDSVGDLTTWSGSRNSPHQMTFGIDASPYPEWEIAAAAAGAITRSIRTHPAVPVTDLALKDRLGLAMAGPAVGSRFSDTENNTIGLEGVASLYTDQYGQLRVGIAVTHYKTDGSGVADTTLQQFNTVHQVAYLIDDLTTSVRQKFSGKILVDDASVVTPGTPAVDVTVIRDYLIGRYRVHQANAIVENLSGFASNLVVERDGSNANRVNVLYPPDLANQLNVLAILFRPYLTLSEG